MATPMIHIIRSALFSLLAVFLISSAQAATKVTDRTCSGVQKAINKLPAGGGEILLSAGVYLCNKPIVMNRDRIKLRGSGPSTVLRLVDNANAPVVVMGTTENIPTRAVRHLVLSDLMIDGNRAKQTSECMGGPCSAEFPLRNNGISVRRCLDCTVDSVTVFGAASGGLVTELGSRRLTVRDYTSYDNEFDGLAGYETEDSTFSGINLYGNKAAGISADIKFNNNKFYDVTIRGNRTVGIFMRDSLDNSFTNLHILDSVQHGIFLAQVDDDPSKAATGNTFSSLMISGSGGAGIWIADSSCVNNMVVATQFVDNRGGCMNEVSSGLVQNLGVICR